MAVFRVLGKGRPGLHLVVLEFGKGPEVQQVALVVVVEGVNVVAAPGLVLAQTPVLVPHHCAALSPNQSMTSRGAQR